MSMTAEERVELMRMKDTEITEWDKVIGDLKEQLKDAKQKHESAVIELRNILNDIEPDPSLFDQSGNPDGSSDDDPQ